MEYVDQFKYLGSMFVTNGQSTEEIRNMNHLAPSTISRLQPRLWLRREISLRTKGRVYWTGAIDSALRFRDVASASGRRKDVGGFR